MPDTYNSKIVLGTGEVLIDLTADTITAGDLKLGVTAHGANGAPITGTNTDDSDTMNDTALVGEVLVGKTFHARGSALTGTMPNRGAVSGTISSLSTPYVIPQGYHDGSGTVGLSSSDITALSPSNVKAGVSYLGETGTYTGEAVSVQSNKNASASLSAAVEVTPDSGYDYLAKVTIAQIPVVRTPNSAGGITVTIG